MAPDRSAQALETEETWRSSGGRTSRRRSPAFLRPSRRGISTCACPTARASRSAGRSARSARDGVPDAEVLCRDDDAPLRRHHGGCAGYVLNRSRMDLVADIRSPCGGSPLILLCPRRSWSACDGPEEDGLVGRLTGRRRMILTSSRGPTIARSPPRWFLAERTVRTTSRTCAQLGMQRRTEAAVYYAAIGGAQGARRPLNPAGARRHASRSSPQARRPRGRSPQEPSCGRASRASHGAARTLGSDPISHGTSRWSSATS